MHTGANACNKLASRRPIGRSNERFCSELWYCRYIDVMCRTVLLYSSGSRVVTYSTFIWRSRVVTTARARIDICLLFFFAAYTCCTFENHGCGCSFEMTGPVQLILLYYPFCCCTNLDLPREAGVPVSSSNQRSPHHRCSVNSLLVLPRPTDKQTKPLVGRRHILQVVISDRCDSLV